MQHIKLHSKWIIEKGKLTHLGGSIVLNNSRGKNMAFEKYRECMVTTQLCFSNAIFFKFRLFEGYNLSKYQFGFICLLYNLTSTVPPHTLHNRSAIPLQTVIIILYGIELHGNASSTCSD